MLTQGRSRTPHLSLKPILTPKVKITIKKKQSTAHTLTPAGKSFTFKHLHPNAIAGDAFGSAPSPVSPGQPLPASTEQHRPPRSARRPGQPRAPGTAHTASPGGAARHGTARADRTFRAPRGAGVAGIKRCEPRGTAPDSAPGTPRPPDRRSPARPGPPLRERSAATPGLRSRRQRRRELPAAAPPRRRAPRSAVPEPRPTCCASGGLTGGGRAAERSCRGAERGRARRTGPGRAGPGGAERPPAAALRPPPRCRRRATSLA